MKSNSYSPNKTRGFRREQKSFVSKNLNDSEYKDDQFFFEKSNINEHDLNQTQENIRGYDQPRNKNRRQKLLDKSDSPNKSFAKANINSRNTKANIGVNSNGVPSINFKSKVKKRLKFTMRNDKMRAQKCNGPRPSKTNKMFEIKDIVSIIGINSRIQTTSNRNPRYNKSESPTKIVVTGPEKSGMNTVNNTIEEIKRTKSENRNSKVNYCSSYTKNVKYSNVSEQNIKKD